MGETFRIVGLAAALVLAAGSAWAQESDDPMDVDPREQPAASATPSPSPTATPADAGDPLNVDPASQPTPAPDGDPMHLDPASRPTSEPGADPMDVDPRAAPGDPVGPAENPPEWPVEATDPRDKPSDFDKPVDPAESPETASEMPIKGYEDGRREGDLAAGQVGLFPFLGAGLGASCLVGCGLGLCLPMSWAAAGAGAGGALAGGATLAGDLVLPPGVVGPYGEFSDAYRAGFKVGYETRVKRNRRNGVIIGAIVGALGAAAVTLLLIQSLRESDTAGTTLRISDSPQTFTATPLLRF